MSLKYAVTALALAGMWFLWSGAFSLHHGLVAAMGGVSVALVLYLSHRLDIVDEEGQPLLMVGPLLGYGPWLVTEIIKANLDVAKRIIDPKLPISPTVFEVTCLGETDLNHVIFANSITLTPGTLSIELEERVITVHALSEHAAQDLLNGQMNRRVAKLEGSA